MTTIPPQSRHSPASMQRMLDMADVEKADYLRKLSKEDPELFKVLTSEWKPEKTRPAISYTAYINQRHAVQRQACLNNIEAKAAFWDDVARFASVQSQRLRARTSLRSVSTEDATNFSLRQAIRLGARLQKHLARCGKSSAWKKTTFKKRGAHLP